MDAFDAARQLAWTLRETIDPGTVDPRTAARERTGAALVRELAARHGVEILRLAPEDPLLFGARAMLDRQALAVFVADERDERETAALIAHELGHLLLHSSPARVDAPEAGRAGSDQRQAGGQGHELCGLEDLEADFGEPVGARRARPYHARERRESQANLFARELLLPAPLARRLFLGGLGADEIARRRVVPLEIVRRQLCEALLAGELEQAASSGHGHEKALGRENVPGDLELDPSQRRAAEHRGSALLLIAGPGTGKTRTLIGRILYLLEQGSDPASILTLTFSNKAAAEIGERLAAVAPAAIPAIWIGTFHGFGLECLRRYHDHLGLDAEFRLLDRADGIALLEERLSELDLPGFRPGEPFSNELAEMLTAIGRAKDERADAERLDRLATAWGERAASAQGKTAEKAAEQAAAARAAELARLYRLYEALLREKNRVDFGDLIALTARLLEQDAAIRTELRLRHRHVLVDEYQDTNRASRDLLKQLAGRGERLWVVGDPRQSIYRFRGASTGQVESFEADFPAAVRRHLEVCYRSTQQILETFQGFGDSIRFESAPPERRRAQERAQSRSQSLSETRAARPGGHLPRLIEAEHPEHEIASLAREVARLRRAGVALRDQAILCRTHRQLEAVARGLEGSGFELLHVGPFFERGEVRDLLSVLSLVVDPAGGALMRLAALPDYAVPLQDVHAFLRWIREHQVDARSGLAAVAGGSAPSSEIARQLPALSRTGRAGLARLASHLEALDPRSSPWQILATYLFEHAGWTRELMREGRRLEAAAIYQCLAFTRAGVPSGRGWPARRLLDRVRRLAALGEERHLAQMPRESLDVDALRLLTLHGAKGLEFDAVHLPGWVRGQLPHRFRPPRWPLPPGLVDGGDDHERRAHDGDEQCLAFVALSRARDHLILYRHRSSGGRRRRPSPFLDTLMPRLAASDEAPAQLPDGLPGDGDGDGDDPIPVETPPVVLGEGDVGLYETCARRFFYSRLVGLPGSRRRSPGADLRRALHHAIDRLREQPALDRETLRRHFESALAGASKAARERAAAAPQLGRLLQTAGTGAAATPLRLPLPAGSFEARPVLESRSGAGAIELLFIRPGSSRRLSTQDASLGLIQEAARRRYGTGGARLEMLFLGDGERRPLLLPQKEADGHVERAEAAARAIGERRFPAQPGPRRCPRCPYFFFCPALPPGDLRLGPAPSTAG